MTLWKVLVKGVDKLGLEFIWDVIEEGATKEDAMRRAAERLHKAGIKDEIMDAYEL